MPDPDPSIDIVITVVKPCWRQPISYWQNLIQPAVKASLHQAGWVMPAELSILLTDDEAIQTLNKQHRQKDKPTNVLSFPFLEPEELALLQRGHKSEVPILLGDIVFAFETIERESLEHNKLFENHLTHLVVHSVLHLLGFDHERDEDADVMESLEIKILNFLNISNPYKE